MEGKRNISPLSPTTEQITTSRPRKAVIAGVEQFHLALFQPEIRWDFVSVELVAVGDDVVVGRRPIGQHCGFVALLLRRRKALQGGPAARPFRTPFEGTHHAIFLMGGDPPGPFLFPAAATFPN